jgi:hypothetical protein
MFAFVCRSVCEIFSKLIEGLLSVNSNHLEAAIYFDKPVNKWGRISVSYEKTPMFSGVLTLGGLIGMAADGSRDGRMRAAGRSGALSGLFSSH